MSSRPRRQDAELEAAESSAGRPVAPPGARSRAARGQRDVPPARPALADGAEADEDEEGAPPAPWHFKVLLVGTAGYLIYRLIWFIFWLTGHAWHG
ncbi:MAG: hypothetical protein M0004_11040 [Actinomycetota bacterium]|nr:hypothetical protein [Actinomycetota bacterium]